MMVSLPEPFLPALAALFLGLVPVALEADQTGGSTGPLRDDALTLYSRPDFSGSTYAGSATEGCAAMLLRFPVGSAHNTSSLDVEIHDAPGCSGEVVARIEAGERVAFDPVTAVSLRYREPSDLGGDPEPESGVEPSQAPSPDAGPTTPEPPQTTRPVLIPGSTPETTPPADIEPGPAVDDTGEDTDAAKE